MIKLMDQVFSHNPDLRRKCTIILHDIVFYSIVLVIHNTMFPLQAGHFVSQRLGFCLSVPERLARARQETPSWVGMSLACTDQLSMSENKER